MQYVPAISFPQLISPSHFIGPSPPHNTPRESRSVTVDQNLSTTGAQWSLLSAHPFINASTPSLFAQPMGTMTLSLPNSSDCNTQQQRLLLPPPSVHAPSVLSPTASSIAHHSELVQVVDTCLTSSIREQAKARVPQSSSSPPQCSPSWPPQSIPLNPSPANFEPQADHGVTSPIEDDDRSYFADALLAKTLNTAFADAPPGNDSLQHTVNPLELTLQSGALGSLDDFPDFDFDLTDNDPTDVRSDSESSSDTSSGSDSSLDDTESDREYGPSTRRIRKGSFSGKSLDTESYPSPPAGTPKTSSPTNGDDRNSKQTTRASGAGGPNASTKRRRSSSPVSPRRLGSKENPINVDKIASLFEPIVIREYVWHLLFNLLMLKIPCR